MENRELEKRLIAAMEEFEIIDCHEHLPPESVRTSEPADVFTLFSHYTRHDLAVSGMQQADYESLYDRDLPLDRRWSLLAPYWERIRWSSYSRAVLLTAEKFYGYDDINEKTFAPLSEAISQFNTPGIYERVLRHACGIKTSLTQCGRTDTGTPLLTPVMPLIYETETWEALHSPPMDPDADVNSLDDYMNCCRAYTARVKAQGAVGLKMVSNPYSAPDRVKAQECFDDLKAGKVARLGTPNPLRDFVIDNIIALAGEQNLVVAVHTGYWGDFRQLDPLHMIPMLERHPEVRFDIYHVGYPFVRDALMLGKGFANVWLNFCWTHIISQKFAVDALDEAMDLVPMNKILAFGGDYGKPVEKVYGHLVMAREDIARALARRIDDKRITEDQALDLALKWFRDNPMQLYNLAL